MSHQEDDGDLASEIMRHRIKRETLAHLRDIRREHGAGAHWATLSLPQGMPRFIVQPPLYSTLGSPAALCAREGDRETRVPTASA